MEMVTSLICTQKTLTVGKANSQQLSLLTIIISSDRQPEAIAYVKLLDLSKRNYLSVFICHERPLAPTPSSIEWIQVLITLHGE